MGKCVSRRKATSSVKLTKADINKLRGLGYSIADIEEIKYAITLTTYEDASGNNLTQEKVIERMGHDEWLLGIAKSAFFIDIHRPDRKGERIRFHSKVYEN